MRVLIADDDPDARKLVRTALEQAGFLVAEVHDGAELYHVLTTSPPGHFEVVVADHHMPRMCGLDVLARTSARARFILLTGQAAEGLAEAGARLGAAAFFRKPMDLSAFVRAVREVAVG